MEAVPAVYMYITCRIVNVDVGCELVIINAENTWICMSMRSQDKKKLSLQPNQLNYISRFEFCIVDMRTFLIASCIDFLFILSKLFSSKLLYNSSYKESNHTTE